MIKRAFTLGLTFVSAFLMPVYAASRVTLFGGDASNGNVTISSNTPESTTVQKNYQSYTIQASRTHTLHHLSVINSLGVVTINGTLAAAQDIRGGAASNYPQRGAGPGGGGPGSNAQLLQAPSGGGGGGNGNDGGRGGCQSDVNANGGLGIGQADIHYCGGGGGGANDGAAGGAGGNGAGNITICAARGISIPSGGLISGVAAAGANAASDGCGGGGGAASQVHLFSQTSIINNGSITLTGGNGGNGAGSNSLGTNGGGGGGSGGALIAMSPSNSLGTVTLTGGSAGTGGTVGAVAGSTGVSVSITGVPNLPVMGAIQNHSGDLIAWARREGGTLNISHFEAADFLAKLDSHGNSIEYVALLTSYMFGGDFAIAAR